MYSTKRLLILIAAFVLFIPNICYSDADISKMGGIKFRDWYFFKDSDKSCYIYTEAKRFKGDAEDIEEAYLYVKGVGKDQYTIGVMPGLDLAHDSVLRMNIDNRDRYLDVREDEHGWTYSSVQDVSVINEMIRADDYLKVYALGYEGEQVVEYYSLKGFNNALKKLAGCYKSHSVVHSKHRIGKKEKVNKVHKKVKKNTSLDSLG